LSSLLALVLASHLLAGEPVATDGDRTPLAIEQTLRDLRSGDWILQWKAMREVAEWKLKEATPAIREIMTKDRRPWVQGRALVALAELLGEEVLREVMGFAQSKTPTLRAAAVEALGGLGTAQGYGTIAERLTDEAAVVRHEAIVALARARGPDAWDTVAKHLADNDPLTVRHATRALAYLATPQATGKLLKLLEHGDAGVREEATRTLAQLRPDEAILPLLMRTITDSSTNVRAAAKNALLAYDPTVLSKPLLTVLRGEDKSPYIAAVEILSQRPTRAVADAVAAIVRKPEDRYRYAIPYALDLLARFDAKAYLDVFRAHLQHDDRNIRRRAIAALARCKSIDLFPLLKPCLADQDPHARSLAFKALRGVKGSRPAEGIVDYLAVALRSDDSRTTKSALELLRAYLTRAELPRAMAAVDRLLASANSDQRRHAARALERVCNAGGKRRVARAQGYVTDWMLLGSFPNDRENHGFATRYAPEDGIDLTKTYESHTFGGGAQFRAQQANCGGERKSSLSLRPPSGPRVKTGSITVAFPLELPDRDHLRLVLFTGIEDEAGAGDGVQFTVRVGRQVLFERRTEKPEGWEPAEIALDEFRDRKVSLEVVVDGMKRSRNDFAVIGEPLVMTEDVIAGDLIRLAPRAKPRVSIPGTTDQVAWTPHRVTGIEGRVELHDIMPPPIEYRVAYGIADLGSAKAQDVQLWIESDDAFRLWLNGDCIGERTTRGNHKIECQLPKGSSRLLIKVCNLSEWWRFRVRITDAQGQRADAVAQGK